MLRDIAVYGAGGYGREIACLIKKINDREARWNFIGYFDDRVEAGTSISYGQIRGNMEVLNAWETELDVVFAISNAEVLQVLYRKVANPLVAFPNIIDPDTVFLDRDSLEMGQGNIVGAFCCFSCNNSLGNFNILNGSISFGHDARIGDFNILNPETRLSGGVVVGNVNFFGLRSAVLQYINVGDNTRVGAGSIVMRNTKDGFLYMGVPAKKYDVYSR